MGTVKVIYIAGAGRSGSTILDRVLGTLDGVSSYNELHRFWLHGFVENQRCSCGQLFRDCSFWTQVVDRAGVKPSDVSRILELQQSVDQSRHFPRLYFPRLQGRSFRGALEEYGEWLRSLYLAIAEVSGASTIVDSSKIPSRALILQQIPDLEVHAIHVVRDPRACVYAWGRKRKLNPATGKPMKKYSPLRTITFWSTRNVLSESLRRRMPFTRVLYEDFATHSRTVLQDLVDRIEPLKSMTIPFVDERSIELGPIHTMSGNPQRFITGLTEMHLDTEWQRALDPGTRRLTTLLTYPLLSRYGYTRRSWSAPDQAFS
jgi:hypothetical protein